MNKVLGLALLLLVALGSATVSSDELVITPSGTLILGEGNTIAIGDSLAEMTSVLGSVQEKDVTPVGYALYFKTPYLIVLSDVEYTATAFNLSLNEFVPGSGHPVPVDDLESITLPRFNVSSTMTLEILIEILTSLSIPFDLRQTIGKELVQFKIDDMTMIRVLFRVSGDRAIHQLIVDRTESTLD
ncbi:MAG: hypothetical protein MI892_18095 [Desulfobacterales bacterium]|nr:hypothetical protein [Desulfobacterales bacterium]